MLKYNKKSGFSFMELVVVIAVLAVLLAVLAPSLLSYVELSRMQKDDSAMEEVVNAVQLAISDSATFDEVYSYCIPNNYVTYTDSSGKYANRTMDEEFWAPDGSGPAVTITFNPEKGKYNISEGIVNDMTFGNGSVAEKRTAEGVQQCYLYEMGQARLCSSVKQTIGDSVRERSATYKNSSYTVFIRFKIVDGTRQADVYGLFNGTNLSEGCPAAIGSNTSSYDEENKPISTTPSGGHQNSNFTNTDLTGGGSLGGFDPSKPLPTYRQCKNGHTFTDPEHKCRCVICYVVQHIYPETGTTMKCERCGYIKDHICDDKPPCSLCGAVGFVVTAQNRHIVGFTGEENESLVIPKTITVRKEDEGYNNGSGRQLVSGERYIVSGIGSSAFKNCANLTSVVLPDSITSIGGYAFNNCSKLTDINIPNGVKSIETETFNECRSLTNITIPNTVTNIGYRAFRACSSFTSIEIPDSVTTIGGAAFARCSNLTSIIIPDKVKTIEDYTFAVCDNLQSVTLGSSITKIGNYAFQICPKLTNINIPNGVTTIGSNAFEGCSSLNNITLPDSLTSIGNYAFYKCSSLASINIPDGVTSIRDSAFQGCSSLTSINIPDGVTYVGNSAFYGCSSITSITIPDGVTSIGYAAFYGCRSLTSINIPDGVTSIRDSAFQGCSSLTSINIPDGVTSIGSLAFYGCSSLTSINIPDGVTSIGYAAFYGCSSITSITIPDGVTSIGGSAFQGCSSLTSINIHGGVTSIGGYAFYGCRSLTSIDIPDGVTSIGSLAFYGCSSLTSINIPDGVTSIGYAAFYRCSKLTSITFNGTKEQWNNGITKSSEWKEFVPSSCIVHCTDGDISIADA